MGRGGALSELLDTLVDSEPGSLSAFDRFLGTLVPGDAPADASNRVLAYAALGSVLTLAAALLLALLPSPGAVQGSGFYAVGRRELAAVLGVAGDAAVPVAIAGGILLLSTAVLALLGQRDGLTEALCVAPPVVGVGALGGAGLGWAALLAVIVVNLVIWIVLAAVVVTVGIALLFGMIGAALDG